LGKADGRYFTFCAGMGLDAEVVRKVERARLRGKALTPALYMRSTVAQFFLDTDRAGTPITMDGPLHRRETGLATVIVQNTTPWTYLRGRAITACPDASFDSGLDVMAMRALNVSSATLAAASLFTGRRARVPGLFRLGKPDPRQMMTLHDLSDFTLTAARPLAFQLDGEYLGERTKVTFSAVTDALRVFS
jgi:diacylglycerol kinase family enzyme